MRLLLITKGCGHDMVESTSEGLGAWLNGKALTKRQLLPRSPEAQL